MEDRLYEVESVRRLTGIRLRKVPDETTILNFPHLLGRHGLGKVLLPAARSILLGKDRGGRRGRSWMPASLRRRHRRRTAEENVMGRWSSPARGSSGASA